jgi:uncharacterized protein (DUF1330 family)
MQLACRSQEFGTKNSKSVANRLDQMKGFSTGQRAPRLTRTQSREEVAMKNYKIAAALISGFVFGAGAASVLAQGTAPYYEVAEINVKDVDAYKKAMSESLPMIKEHGGTYVAGGFEKAKSRVGSPVSNRYVVIRYPNKEAADKLYDDGLKAWMDKNATIADFRIVGVEGVEAK